MLKTLKRILRNWLLYDETDQTIEVAVEGRATRLRAVMTCGPMLLCEESIAGGKRLRLVSPAAECDAARFDELHRRLSNPRARWEDGSLAEST